MHLGGTVQLEQQRPRILMVEDEAQLLRVLSRFLERAGFDVEAAQNGHLATELLAKHTFDAVVTDLSMPGLSGVDVLRAARATDLEVPVLLMTGAPDVSSAAEAVHYGACEYVVKPFSPDRLAQLLRRAVGLSRMARAQREAMHALGIEQTEAGDRAGLEVTLTRALDSMWMAYQPIVAAETGALYAYEALLRSDEPALPNPEAILSAAEKLGRLEDVGRAVREKAPAPIRSAPAPALLFVNLHATDLTDETLGDETSPLTAIAPRVVLELTERAALPDAKDVRFAVAALREKGFRFAIDDLGAGYAGLSTFATLEPEFVKLDMSLVRNVHLSDVRQKLVRSMTVLCRDMGISVVAEGIELVEERDAIVDLGCELLQGYLYARPSRAMIWEP
ncbi:MAG TPA: EAL domain-containing protein [Polyangiaceae bacterium]|nr:EAL domain-containing protein [Polyangiaceae bacterium]